MKPIRCNISSNISRYTALARRTQVPCIPGPDIEGHPCLQLNDTRRSQPPLRHPWPNLHRKRHSFYSKHVPHLGLCLFIISLYKQQQSTGSIILHIQNIWRSGGSKYVVDFVLESLVSAFKWFGDNVISFVKDSEIFIIWWGRVCVYKSVFYICTKMYLCLYKNVYVHYLYKCV